MHVFKNIYIVFIITYPVIQTANYNVWCIPQSDKINIIKRYKFKLEFKLHSSNSEVILKYFTYYT